MEEERNRKDEQGPPPRDGAVDALTGSEPDGIPMTGEEDPLAEVSDGEFSEVVAEFTRSEHDAKQSGGGR